MLFTAFLKQQKTIQKLKGTDLVSQFQNSPPFIFISKGAHH
jgi:hypothetical protein